MGAKKPYGGFFLLKFWVKKARISCSAQTPLWTKSKSDEALCKTMFWKI
jgi:hypothetical protein